MRTRFFLASLFALALAPPAARLEAQSESIARQTTRADQALDTLEAKVDPNVKRYCGLKPSSTLSYMRNSVCVYYLRETAKLRVAVDSLRQLLGTPTPPPPPPAPTVSRVDIHATASSVNVGQSLQIIAEPRDASGTLLATAVSWRVADTSIANISGTGLLTGRRAGESLVSATSGGVTGTRTFTVVSTTSTDTTTQPQPPPQPTPNPTPDTTQGIARLPQNVPAAQYPVCTNVVVVAPPMDLQAAINGAAGGTCLELQSGATWIGNYVLPNRSSSGIVTITTQGFVSQPGTRMTPSRAPPLAKIRSASYVEVLGTAPGAHDYIVRGVELATAAGAQATGMNVLVRITDAVNGTNSPRNIQFQQVYVHGTPTLDMRRCFRGDGLYLVLIDSWVDDCHSNNSDSQAWLGLNCSKYQLIQNNTLRAGHEIVMFGGGDPTSQSCQPSDIVLRGNHILHPVGWFRVWQVKNCVETKNVIGYLIEFNVIENCWPDAQAGFAFVLKSENQDCTAAYTTTSDLTIRWNLLRNVASAFNLSGKGSSSCPNVAASRFDIRHNLIQNVRPAAWGGDGICFQLLSQATDMQLRRNTCQNSTSANTAITMDGAAMVRLVMDGNAMHHGAYGIKGAGTGDGTASLTAFAPGYVFTNNVVVGGSPCTQYPATTLCPTTFAGLPTASAGADSVQLMAKIAGVIVNDPLVAQRARSAIPRSALTHPWRESPAACRKAGEVEPSSCDLGVKP